MDLKKIIIVILLFILFVIYNFNNNIEHFDEEKVNSLVKEVKKDIRKNKKDWLTYYAKSAKKNKYNLFSETNQKNIIYSALTLL